MKKLYVCLGLLSSAYACGDIFTDITQEVAIDLKKAQSINQKAIFIKSYNIKPVLFKTGQAPAYGAVFGDSVTEVEFDLNNQFQIESLALTLSSKNGPSSTNIKPNRMYFLALVNSQVPAIIASALNSQLNNDLAAFGKQVWQKGVYIFPFLVSNGSIVTDFTDYTNAQIYVAMYDSNQKPVGVYSISSDQASPATQSPWLAISSAIAAIANPNWTSSQNPNFVIHEAQIVINGKSTVFPFGNIIKIVGK